MRRPEPSLADLTSGRAGGMDALRLLAASLVIVAHSYALTSHAEPLARFDLPELGDVAVGMFFAISGFLVTASWVKDPSVLRFAIRRGLRILPGLWVVIVLSALALGATVTTLGPGAYYGDLGTWRYIAERAVVFARIDHLPGVFDDNPYGPAVNGSLWTLPVEMSAYVGTVLFGLIGAFRGNRWVLLVGTLGLLALQEVIPSSGSTADPGSVLYWVVHFGIFYAIATCLFVFGTHVPARRWIAGIALLVWIATFGTSAATVVSQLAIPYAVIVLGYSAPTVFDRVTRRLGDISYGTYIYAFPVQQTIIHYDDRIGPGRLMIASMLATYLCAWISWRVVEHPALRLRARFRRR